MAKTATTAATGGARERSRSPATARARKLLIADAVIDILAQEGARNLTHRRIDTHLELPQGATSYYFPSRFELLKAGFNKLFDDGLEGFTRCYQGVIRKLDAGEAIDIDLVADAAYRHWRSISQASQRDLAIARFEFFLMATHDARLLAIQKERRRVLFDLTTKVFDRLGCRNPSRASSEFSARAQGDYISRFIAPSFTQTTMTAADFAVRIQQVIADCDTVRADPARRADQAELIAI